MTILIFILFFVLLGGVGFIPAPQFTAGHRSIVGTVLALFFLWWVLKHFALM